MSMSQFRQLTGVEYLCLLHIEHNRRNPAPLTRGGLELLMHPHPCVEAADALGQMGARSVPVHGEGGAPAGYANEGGLVRMAQHPSSNAPIPGTMVTTEEGRRALFNQRHSVLQSLDDAIEVHLGRAASLRGGKTPRESSAKEEERRAEFKRRELRDRIARLQRDVFATMPVNAEQRRILDEESTPKTRPPETPVVEDVEDVVDDGDLEPAVVAETPAKKGKAGGEGGSPAPAPRRRS